MPNNHVIPIIPITSNEGPGMRKQANDRQTGQCLEHCPISAQEYINSIIDLYASWGIDFIKLDSVTPGSYNHNLNLNNIPDVQAYSKAIALS